MRPLLTLVFVCLLTGLALSYLAMVLLPFLFDLSIVDLIENPVGDTPPTDSNRMAMALLLWQGLSSLGFFILPGWWFIQNHRRLTQANFRLSIFLSLGGVVITVLCFPMVNNLFHLNQGLPYSPLAEAFPSFKDISHGWQEAEKSFQQKLTLLLSPNGSLFWLLSTVVLAILPALGEEIVFRGSLQPLLQQSLRSPHAAIWVSALMFSAIHRQWLGFVPRCLLGALFGYMVLWSGSLWPAILSHMSNNLLSLMAFKLNWFSFRSSQNLPETTFHWENNPFPWSIALGLWGLAIVGLFYYQKTYRGPKFGVTDSDANAPFP